MKTIKQDAQEFYRENKLYPLVVGAGVAVRDRSMQQIPVVTYVLYNEEENYMMVVEYHQDEICVLAVGAGVEFGTDQMKIGSVSNDVDNFSSLAVVDNSFQDMWLVTDPVFYSQEACLAYGREYRQQIYEDAMDEFYTTVQPTTMLC